MWASEKLVLPEVVLVDHDLAVVGHVLGLKERPVDFGLVEVITTQGEQGQHLFTEPVGAHRVNSEDRGDQVELPVVDDFGIIPNQVCEASRDGSLPDPSVSDHKHLGGVGDETNETKVPERPLSEKDQGLHVHEQKQCADNTNDDHLPLIPVAAVVYNLKDRCEGSRAAQKAEAVEVTVPLVPLEQILRVIFDEKVLFCVRTVSIWVCVLPLCVIVGGLIFCRGVLITLVGRGSWLLRGLTRIVSLILSWRGVSWSFGVSLIRSAATCGIIRIAIKTVFPFVCRWQVINKARAIL